MTGAQIADRVTSLSYRAGWTLTRHLPERVVSAAFDQIGAAAHRRGGRGVQQLRRNLARVRPELGPEDLDALTADAMKSYLRYWQEAFRLPEWSRAEIDRRIRATNEHELFDRLDAGQGVVAVLGHFGNWDHGGAWVTGQGYHLTTVAERLRPASVFDQFVAYRESLGMTVLPLGGPDVTPRLQQRLRDGGLVALLADRDLTSSGVDVDLLGEPARMPIGPALLAERTGAALLPVISHYGSTAGQFTPDPTTQPATYLEFRPPLVSREGSLRARVLDLTRQWAAVVGTVAREHARDWHMLQPIWSADLAGRTGDRA